MNARVSSAASSRIDRETEQAVRLFLAKLRGGYDAALVIVFGSRARRTHRPDSDADLALVLRGPRQSFWKTKLALSDVAYDVLLETGVLIQPLPIWEDDWNHPEQSASRALLQNISREGVRV
jgi:predicted nucleotidyltransferase